MVEHPGAELQVLIREKGLTQKAFSSILGKKVSEVNELLKGKRNITIQRDYLLHQTLGTPIKYWIFKQVDYDYSLLDIEDQKSPPSVRGEAPKELGGFSDQTRHSEQNKSPLLIGEGQDEVSENHTILNDSEESTNLSSSFGTEGRIQENTKQAGFSTHKRASEGQTKSQKFLTQEPNPQDSEDFKKRARIFKSF